MPVLAAVVTTLLTLGIGSALLVGATFGLAKAYAVMGLLWFGTIGLPTSLGVVGVAALWGRLPLLSGMAGFCVVAALAGLALLSTIGAGLAAAVRDEARREPALITFLITASGLQLFGIGAAFWGIVAGLFASVVLHAPLRGTVTPVQPEDRPGS